MSAIQEGADEAGLQRYEQARNLGREFVVKAGFLKHPCAVLCTVPAGDRKGRALGTSPP